jgi:hypothetical protein
MATPMTAKEWQEWIEKTWNECKERAWNEKNIQRD